MDKLGKIQNDPAKRKQAQKKMVIPESMYGCLGIVMLYYGVQVGKNG